MFLLGVRIDHASAVGCFVILEKTLKNVRHFYTVQSACRVPAEAGADYITAFYKDSAYTIRKRIYSQDRRPKKDVSASPTIVVAAGQKDLPLVNRLRQADIPVEAILLAEDFEDHPDPAPGRAGVGKDYPASETPIGRTLAAVLAQQRICWPTAAPGRDEQTVGELAALIEALPRQSSSAEPDERMPALLLAAAAPVWFRENIRYTSAYRTSSTSIRRFK